MRVLIADDELLSRTLLSATLTKLGHEVIALGDGGAAIAELLRREGPRLAIVDWMMPGVDGLEVCRRVRTEADGYVYMILLTARDGAEDMIVGLDAGADDFLTKPFNVHELGARLRSGQRVLDLEDGLLAAQETLRRHATLDHLTGLWNRRMILEQLDREVGRVRREKRPVTVMMADIDRFKSINDTHGHAAGDAVIRDTSAAIRSQLRGYDAVGRYGGEEFLVVIPGGDADHALRIAERIRATVESRTCAYGQLNLQVTISVGVAHDPTGLPSPVLVKAADDALYRAKANGRNRVEIARSFEQLESLVLEEDH